MEVCKQTIDEYIRKGWLVPSRSPYASPILFVAKKNGGVRLCCDYRALNRISVKQRWPLPNISELIDKLQGARYFSTLDLVSGYMQLRLHPDDQPKTAIRTPFGLYEWKVLCFGLSNAPSHFQSAMHKMFEPLIAAGKALVYVDDLIVMGRDPATHLANLREVLQVLRDNKLYASRSKCSFFQTSAKFLGLVIDQEGVRMDPAKVASVRDWPRPTSAHEVRQFLGFANYFRKFVQGMGSLCAPLNDLTQKDVDFKQAWTGRHTTAFEALKHALITAPVLKLPDFDRPFTVISDASLLGTGAVLMQDEHPVAYTSKKFTPAERNYTTTEQEMLGIVRALDEWRYALEGPEVTLVTDHNPLTFLPTQASLSRRCARWMEFLARFHVKWEYRPGRINVADPLSRNPALALGILAGWAHMLTRSGTGKLPPAPARLVDAAPQLPTRKRRAPVAQPAAINPVNSSDTRDNSDNRNPGDIVPPPPFTDRIKAGYAVDSRFQDPEVRAQFPVSSTGLIYIGDRVYVPDVDTLRTDIIRDMHTSAYAGHTGTHKTYHAVAQLFFWEGMRADVARVVSQCHSCQTFKSSNTAPAGLLMPTEVPDAPWETITTDLITDLPRTRAGHTAIVVFVDRLTKMVHIAPTTSQCSAEDFARLFMENVVKLHGLPRKIISDRDPRFTGKFMTTLCELLGTRQAFSTSFHPCTDGQSERTNRTLQEMLRHYVHPRHDDWDQHLAAAEFAINNSRHDVTRHTPFYLNYGRNPLTPMATMLPGTVKNDASMQWHDTLHANIQKARTLLFAAQDRMKQRADPKRRDVHFAPGDRVMLSMRNIKFKSGTRKLHARWTGPFTITQMVGPEGKAVAAKLALPAGWKIHPVFHVSLLKHWRSDGTNQPAPPPLSFDPDDGAPIWEVECLLKERVRPSGESEFLTRWKGFGSHEDSWTRESDVLDPALIAELRRRSGPVR
jgi:hypothetical protein